jgi:hypothetical protein
VTKVFVKKASESAENDNDFSICRSDAKSVAKFNFAP